MRPGDERGVAATADAPTIDERDPGVAVDLSLIADDQRFVRTVELAPASLRPLGRRLVDLAHPDDRSALRIAVERAEQTETPQRLIVSFDCHPVITMALRVVSMQSDGGQHIRVTGLDIGERRREATAGARNGTVDELELAKQMLNLVPCALFLKDLDRKFVVANEALLTSFGLTSNRDIIGKSDFDFHPRAEAELYDAMDLQIIETGEPIYDVDETQTRRDGSVEVVRTTKVPVRNRAGDVVGLMGYSTDVTEPTRVGEALVASEQRYALAARATRDGIWDYDVAANEIYLTPRCAHLFDVPVSNDPVRWPLVVERLGPEAANDLTASVRSLHVNPSDSFALEAMVTHTDGQERWLTIVGTALVVDGQVTRVVGSVADNTLNRRREAQWRHQARHDNLTGLANRPALEEAISARPGALLYLDLDSFKVINDSLGHQAGDEILRAVAARLSAVIGDDVVFARLGGDEFAILLETTSTIEALRQAEAIQEAISSPFKVSGLEIYTTASIGIVAGDNVARRPVDVLRHADIALYEAKAAGKARASLFEPSMQHRAEQELELQMRIRRAVDDMEFILHYQPIFDARTKAVIGLEALLRWAPPRLPMESPSSFLPYLEETKLIVDVGRWVIDEGCRQLAEWRTTLSKADDLHLAINISRAQFGAADLVDDVIGAIERHGLAPGDVVVEITETAVSERPVEVHERLRQLRSHGVRVAIDDFGVGQSSLSVLYDLPADILKIDRSFTERIKPGHEPVTDAVLKLARSLGLETVAEGIELQDQADWLVAHDCSSLQGYLLSKPLAAEAVPEFLLRR